MAPICFALAVLLIVVRVLSLPSTSACPPYNSSKLEIHQYQLYPKNADWDDKNCILYIR